MIAGQLTHLDNVFLSIEKSHTPMHTAGVVIFEASAPFEKVYETIASRLHLVPRFTQRIMTVPFGLGTPFWVQDPAFDLSFHLRHAALPKPGTDEQLCDYAARLISRPLDRTRPLWEIYVIEGLEDDRSAIVAKTHHAMVDGLSSMDLATVLFDFTPEAQPAPPGKIDTPSRLPSSAELIAEALKRQASDLTDLGTAVRAAAAAPGRILDAAGVSLGAVTSFVGSVIKPAPPSPLNVRPGLSRRFAIVRSTLQTFKDIKNVSGATVNDVVLTVCADALGKLFRSRSERTEGRSLRAMVPVSVRAEESVAAGGNEVSAVFPDLPIGTMKPLERLDLVHDQLADIKSSKEALGADVIVNLSRWAPPTLHAMAARVGAGARMMNVVISNVPGPQVPLYSCGVKMLEPYAVIPLAESQSLSIGVTSYNEGIFFGMNADRDAHPDLDQLARYIDESISELQKAAAEVSSEDITKAETQFAVGSEG
ncbi:MAG: wax ester/triacylglycerol synthase family O-acyltransferase [Actinobacteria bacterium]|nr:wax ester/triacylglycerol synthase family O-acyltransferase [Actinomycetota bacterium]